MSKKIVVLNGSPRPKGNTAALIDQFVKGAGEAGHQVSRFDLFKMDIHPVSAVTGAARIWKAPASRRTIWIRFTPPIWRRMW